MASLFLLDHSIEVLQPMLMSYVVRRGAIYWFRRAIPLVLREVIGKREVLISLRTSSPQEAKRLAHPIAAKVEQMFRDTRAALVSPAAADYQAAQDILARPEREQEGISLHLVGQAEDGDKRAERLLRALNASSATSNGTASPPISMVLDRWISAKKPPPKTIFEWRRCIKILVDLVGDLPISSLTKSHLRDYQRHLGSMLGRTGTPLSSASQAKMLGAVRSVLSFAVGQGDLEVNPGDGLRVLKTSREELQVERRLPYSAQDLAVLFSSAALAEREKAGPASVWLPWLGLWTGARLAELTDLRVQDVGCEDGVHFLRLVTDGDDRRVKNVGSHRRVPVASALVDLGFLKYVEERRAAGEKWIFDLSTTSYGSRSAAVSKWYGRHARGLGIVDKAKVFHSFRHGMLDALRRAGVEPEIRARLLGHEVEGMAGRYGTGHTLEQLRDAIERVRHDGIDADDGRSGA